MTITTGVDHDPNITLPFVVHFLYLSLSIYLSFYLSICLSVSITLACSYYEKMKHPYVKSTLFGPDIERFSMPLPVMYPNRAGQAAGAFRLQLMQYEASRRKADSQKIPTSLADRYVHITPFPASSASCLQPLIQHHSSLSIYLSPSLYIYLRCAVMCS